MNDNTEKPTAVTRHYTLVCAACGMHQDDDGLILDCPGDHEPALLRTQYNDHRFSPSPDDPGIFRYRRWLPVARIQQNAGRATAYRSERLAAALGLTNLWISFSGYWPERGATLETATFKELEASAVLGRLPERRLTLTVASAGNTGAAFALACSRSRVPCLLIVPERGLDRFRFRESLHPCVNLVAIEDGDYPDAIELAAEVSKVAPFQAEGGVKNVGRRDGLATVLLSAFEEMGCLPSYYFQAVGSGTGAIAVLEAARRLQVMVDGAPLPRLMLCQNRPFTPIYDAWRTRMRSVGHESTELFREAIRDVHADELTNWTPPYGIKGGVYDSLVASRGAVLAADNAAVMEARNMFLDLEGIDIEPAPGVAVACLRDAVARRLVENDSAILLNITGGGRSRFGRDYSLTAAEPRLRISEESIATGEALRKVTRLSGIAEEIGS